MVKRIILLIIFYYNNIYVFAVDFKSLEKYTLAESNLLKVSKIDIDISRSELDYIFSNKYPSLAFGLSSERSKGLNNDLETTFYVDNNSVSQSTLYKSYSYLSTNYNLYDFGRLDYKIKAQEHDIKAKQNEFCIKQNEISQKLLDTYFDTKISQLKQNYLTEILKYTGELYEYYNRLYKIGNVQKMDVLSNAIELANLYNDLNSANKDFIENLERLSNISNYNLKENEKLESLSIEKKIIYTKFEDTSLAKKYMNEIKSKQSEIKLINAEYFPQINFFGKYDFYGYDENSFSHSFDNFQENSYKYGFSISWNIFDGFKTKSQKKKAIYELNQLRLKYEQARNDFNTQLNTLDKTYKYYTNIIKKDEKRVALSKDNTNIAFRLNKIGEIDKSIQIKSMIKKLYASLELKQAQETISYKILKKELLLNGDIECIVH